MRKSEVGGGGDGTYLDISWPFCTSKPRYTSSINLCGLATANRIASTVNGQLEMKVRGKLRMR
jgi:hypothetical protein